LFRWHFQPLTSPQALNALVIDPPAGISQQSCNPTIAISTILAHQFDHVCHQAIFVCTAPWSASLGRTVLTKDQTDPALGYIQLATHSVDAGSTTRGA
jgi:hypothetical protein